MRVSLISVLLVFISVSAGWSQTVDTMSDVRSAYMDTTARTLVAQARARRDVADLSIDAYTALSKERTSVGLRGLRRDRLLYRREVAGRIEWTRDGPGKIEVLGAREAVPVVMKGVQLPSDLNSYMPHLAFDPADPRMLIGETGNDFIRFPLAPGAERYYQFRTGSTTSIQLPDGKKVRLIELEVIPRTVDSRNLTGSVWLEEDTHSIVQAAFRLARDIDIIRDLADDEDKKDMKDLPGFIKPITFSVDYMTIEYSLYDLKWWLPRSVLFEGSMRAGFLRTPMQYERTYSDYQIHAAARPVAISAVEMERRDSLRRVQRDSCAKQTRMTVNVKVGTPEARAAARAHRDSLVTQTCGRWQVTMSSDTASLLNSPELPANPFATGEDLLSEGELKELRDRIEKLGGGVPMLPAPVTDFSLLSMRELRYNRIEALSVGARGQLDYGALIGTGKMRFGLADKLLKPELSIAHPGRSTTVGISGFYNRLNGFDPFARPFSFGSSLSAFFFGRDDADYYRSSGAELMAEPSGARARWYSLRLFAQRERSIAKQTDFSLRHLLNGDYEFRPNLLATTGSEYGSELTLRFSHGVNPAGLRFGAELYSHAAAGTNDFARGALTLRTAFPLHGPLAGALEAGAGLTSVAPPLQHLWYLGGPSTLRGYNAGVLSGDAFWRGRAELGYGLPAGRLVGFSDFGWAGPRDRFDSGKPLVGVGAGASFLDGILRLDVARGLRAPKGWSASFYFDAAL